MEPLNKEYWEERYKNNDTAWDAGSITPPIQQYIGQLKDKGMRILVPGAGNGHEFIYLAENGFNNACVLDIAYTPLQHIATRLPGLSAERLINGDFFEHNGTYNLIIEQTFFCALPPALRKNYAEKMHSLLAPGGKLAGLLFDFELTQQGPPFGGSREEYVNLFAPLYKINMLHRAYNSIKPREGKELFFIFEKK